MREFINFHQVDFEKDNLAIKKLFALETNLSVGLQQFQEYFNKNPKNPNQIEINNKPEIIDSLYNEFIRPIDAFETIKTFVLDELKIKNSIVLKNSSQPAQSQKPKKLYFYVFERDLNEDSPKLRGVFYATSHANKPIFCVALTKSLEYDYEKEIYKK